MGKVLKCDIDLKIFWSKFVCCTIFSTTAKREREIREYNTIKDMSIKGKKQKQQGAGNQN